MLWWPAQYLGQLLHTSSTVFSQHPDSLSNPVCPVSFGLRLTVSLLTWMVLVSSLVSPLGSAKLLTKLLFLSTADRATSLVIDNGYAPFSFNQFDVGAPSTSITEVELESRARHFDSAVPFSEMYNANGYYFRSGMCRAGFAGDDAPRVAVRKLSSLLSSICTGKFHRRHPAWAESLVPHLIQG